jgi:hypothetical protein
MRQGWLSLLALSSLWSPAALTADKDPQIVTCLDCTDDRARAMAESQIPMSWPAGVYDVYIVDGKQGKLRRYRVWAEREGRTGFNQAGKRTPAADYQGWFDEAMAEWHYVADAAKPGLRLDPGIPIDGAEQVFGNQFNQTVVSEQINRSIPLRIGSLFGAALSIFKSVFVADIVVEVEFRDGSTALFVLDRIDDLLGGHPFVYVYRKGSARDSDGNQIPDSQAAFDSFQGTFTTEGNLDRFIRQADGYNARWLDRVPERLPAHTVCVMSGDKLIECWHN